MKKWLIESEESLSKAMEALKGGGIPKENLYKLAPLYYSEKRKTNNESLIQEMCDVNDQQIEQDCSFDPDSIKRYKFNYVSSYLYCYVVAGKMDDFKHDNIMEYVNSHMDLFSD
ncbi:hypothetical protein EKO29_14245 [Colwellia sp. Arc7-635]|uniref:hypothetical protein n=1 Tax=Colwellia sp. Arc7-635 TaxID=2497879 RepID=UPI000F8544C7|nr:hypothetical protein [Colwellia sp. Arc7-635]AZQ85038.1 hypothetical protein EKO29_14245 [Colwellia sp. Arc7-635]